MTISFAHLRTFLCIFALINLPTTALAITPMTTAQLIAQCDAYSSDASSAEASACIHYIQGFVAGAIATDERVSRNVVKQMSETEDYAQRYAEVRFGRQLEEFGPTYFAEFCVPEEVPLAEVVEKIVFDLQDPSFLRDQPLARDAVYRALRKDYACE